MATIAENLNIIESVKGEIKDILSLDNHLESYPNAIAEGLTDEAELQTISERTTADGASIKNTCAYVKSIHGNCVKWNQLIGYMNINTTNNGVTITYLGDGKYSVIGTATARSQVVFAKKHALTQGHKYLYMGGSTDCRLYYSRSPAIDCVNGTIFVCDQDLSVPYTDVVSGTTINKVIKPYLFDLTAMGWEDITSADEFAQRLGYDNASSLPYFAYDEGSIKTFNATKIVSKDSDGETIGELSTDIPSLFADGLCSAGTAYDEVTKNKAVKRIGKVDLGTLTWLRNTSIDSGDRWQATISNMLSGVVGQVGNIICPSFITVESSAGDVTPNHIFNYTNNRLFINVEHDAYSTGAELKSAMDGIYLYYELAEPTEQTLTERKSWYKVSANGKEQIVGTNSAPMKAEIAYRYDEDELEALASAAGI